MSDYETLLAGGFSHADGAVPGTAASLNPAIGMGVGFGYAGYMPCRWNL
jgi:hypothetical protein